MEFCHRQRFVHGLCHHGHIGKRVANLVDSRKVAGDPKRKLVSSHVSAPHHGRLSITGALREVETRDSKTRVVTAIEIERHVVHHNTHANDSVAPFEICRATERPGDLCRVGRHHHALTIALGPIEIAAKEHLSRRVGKADARAHRARPCLAHRTQKASERLDSRYSPLTRPLRAKTEAGLT